MEHVTTTKMDLVKHIIWLMHRICFRLLYQFKKFLFVRKNCLLSASFTDCEVGNFWYNLLCWSRSGLINNCSPADIVQFHVSQEVYFSGRNIFPATFELPFSPAPSTVVVRFSSVEFFSLSTPHSNTSFPTTGTNPTVHSN